MTAHGGRWRWRLSSPRFLAGMFAGVFRVRCAVAQQHWYVSAYESCTVACFRIDLMKEKARKDEKSEKGVWAIVSAKGDDSTFLGQRRA